MDGRLKEKQKKTKHGQRRRRVKGMGSSRTEKYSRDCSRGWGQGEGLKWEVQKLRKASEARLHWRTLPAKESGLCPRKMQSC